MVEKQRINSNFTCIANEVIHSNLDGITKAVLYYALSFPEDHSPNRETIMKDLHVSSDKFQNISRELQNNGYLSIVRSTCTGKTFYKYKYTQPNTKTSFTKVPNQILKNKYLESDAKALLIYGLSFAANWKFNKPSILKDNKLGEWRWRRIYKQLTQFGYLEYKPHMSVVECDYIFRSEPKLTPKSLNLQQQANDESYNQKIRQICLMVEGHDTNAPRLNRHLRTRLELLDPDIYKDIEFQICDAIIFALEMKKKYKIKQNAFQQYESYYSDLKLDMKGLYFPRSIALACDEIDIWLKTIITILFNVSDKSTSDIIQNTLLQDAAYSEKYFMLQKNNEVVTHPKEGTIYWFTSDYEDIIKARGLIASMDPFVDILTQRNFEKLLEKKNNEQTKHSFG